MGIFDIFKKNPKVGGIIKYLKLEDWWANDLDDNERKIILKTYSPLGSSRSIIEGTILGTSETQLHFLWGLVGWFDKPELRHIAHKIITKAESLINKDSDPLDAHFLYGAKLEVCYKERETRSNGLELAIEACRQQISYATAAAKEFINRYGNALPGHKGYQQLAIILEKQERYPEAIELCEQAKLQGWAGDWDKRIERCSKKIKT